MAPLCSAAWKGEKIERHLRGYFVTFGGGISWGEKARDELREADAGVPVHFVLVLSLCSKSIF